MSLQASISGNAKVYNITESARSALPNWLEKANKKSLRRDESFQKRIELIQDFGFPSSCVKLKATRDGRNIIATGVYKPQMRVFELSELSMKFDRHTDCENVQFEVCCIRFLGVNDVDFVRGLEKDGAFAVGPND
jgi:ribosome biogenesis protein ENP2